MVQQVRTPDGINPNRGSGSGGGGDLVGVWLVTDAAQAQYPSITAALAAASSGDAVVVGPGDYAESFSVPAGVALRAHTRGTVTVPLNSQDVLIQVEREIDLRNAGPSDELFVALERDGTADTYNGSIGVAPDDEVEVRVYY